MTYTALVIGVCLLGQAPGGADDFAPIRVPAGRAAPAADLGDMPSGAADSTVAEQPPAYDGADIPPAAEQPSPFDRYQTEEPPADRYRAQQQPASDSAAQPPAAARDQPTREVEPTGPLETLGTQPRQKLRPPELIAEALENPKQPALVGTPLTLTQALSRAAGRQQQFQITQAYWRLATAQADYHWALAQRELLGTHTGTHAQDAGTQSVRAAAEADVRDAQLNVEAAQATLANLLGPAAGQQTPLATDRPHVGDYRTYYENIFGNRVPPTRIRLIQRTLPVRRRAIDAHAEAIVAALDAVEATGEQFQTTGQGLATLLDAIDLLKQQRRAFIDEVRNYNLDIAEYAFAVAPAGVGGDTLVSMLIRTSPSPDTPKRAAVPGAAPRKTLRPHGAAPDDGGTDRR